MYFTVLFRAGKSELGAGESEGGCCGCERSAGHAAEVLRRLHPDGQGFRAVAIGSRRGAYP